MLEIRNFTQNKINEKIFRETVRTVLDEVEVQNSAEISLAIVGDSRMRKLNKMYRGSNRVTDVLSFGDKSVFPYLIKAFSPKEKKEKFVEAPDGINRLGEIIICYPRAKKQARKSGHSLEKELIILLIHGTLHLLGYDHEKGLKEKEQMEEMEDKIFKKIGKFK